ncbi:MAG: hypothetical protein IJE78_05115 [Bacteroidaceae bacterium]|nr:hypothetical protein [Bacteroidaceae bacterium]
MKRYIRSTSILAACTPAQIKYVDKCLSECPDMPDCDPDDCPEAWSQYWADLRDYKSWCFADAVEDDVFFSDESAKFDKCWKELETRRAQPFA